MSTCFRVKCAENFKKPDLFVENVKQAMFSRTICVLFCILLVSAVVIVSLLPAFLGLYLDGGFSGCIRFFGFELTFRSASVGQLMLNERHTQETNHKKKSFFADRLSFPCSNTFKPGIDQEIIHYVHSTLYVATEASHDHDDKSRTKSQLNVDTEDGLNTFGVKQSLTADYGAGLSIRKHKPKQEVTVEALASLNLARERLEQGNVDKARKLFEHAVALDATHPDVVNEYGEFLEKHQKDVISAEHMYCRALSLSPSHSKALSNHKRTLPLVEEMDQNRFNRIEKKREFLFQIPESHPGLRRVKKESYFKHIHHTTAIEGNTFTLNQARALIETRMAIGGKSIIEHNEIIGMDAALSYLNSTLLHRIGSITIQDILEIHKRVMGFVDPVEAGKFRSTQVFVGDHIPPVAGSIDQHMEEFVTWLNSEEAMNLHPIEYAALAHYRLVYIHPFYDGNGRTSRLLMNVILMQAGYPPVTIKKEVKHEYYQYLQAGNNGDIRPFIRFIARCTEQTIDEYLWALSDKPNTTFPELSSDSDDGRTIILENHNARHP